MKKLNSYIIISTIIIISACGQTNTRKVQKDGIIYNEKAVVAPTENMTAMENYNAGYKAFQAENYKKAISFYKQAISLDSKYVDAYDNCGLSYRRLGNLDSAAYFYKKSIEINPSGQIAHGNLAIVYSTKGENENAIKEYKEISKYNPNDPEAPYGIAGIYLDLKQYDKALVFALKAVKLCEKYQPRYIGDAYYYVGLCYLNLNNKDEANEFMQRAILAGTPVPKEIKIKLGLK